MANYVVGENKSLRLLIDAVYPVGSIYMSVNDVNPSTLFGGTWVAWGNGRVPVGVNASDSNFNTVEKTGGASTVALSTAQMPSHTHTGPSHTHSVSGHTHSVPNHAHSIPNHSHWAYTGTAATTQMVLCNCGENPNLILRGNNHVAATNNNVASTVTIDSGANLPGGNHTHPVTIESGGAGTTGSGGGGTTGSGGSGKTGAAGTGSTGSAGSGQAHSNLQPYITCYMWKRTA